MTEDTQTKMVSLDDLFKAAGVTEKTEVKEEVNVDKIFSEVTNTSIKEVEVPLDKIIAQDPLKNVEVEPTIKKAEPTKYADKLRELVTLGLVDDMQIAIGEGEDEKLSYISEFTDLDESTFTALITQIKEVKDKELKEKYITREGLDERTEKYIELKKAGGDISKLIEQEVEYVSPLTKYNLNEEEEQKRLIRDVFINQGMHPRVVEMQITAFTEDMILDLESQKIVKTIEANFNAHVEAKKQEQLVLIEEERKQDKEFRKGLNEEIKHLIKDENLAKLLLDNSTKRDTYGLTNIDQLYYDAQKYPKRFAKIAFLLNNEEAFLKSVGAKAAIKEIAKTTGTILRINPKTVKTAVKENKIDDLGVKVFEELTIKHKQ